MKRVYLRCLGGRHEEHVRRVGANWGAVFRPVRPRTRQSQCRRHIPKVRLISPLILIISCLNFPCLFRLLDALDALKSDTQWVPVSWLYWTSTWMNNLKYASWLIPNYRVHLIIALFAYLCSGRSDCATSWLWHFSKLSSSASAAYECCCSEYMLSSGGIRCIANALGCSHFDLFCIYMSIDWCSFNIPV